MEKKLYIVEEDGKFYVSTSESEAFIDEEVYTYLDLTRFEFDRAAEEFNPSRYFHQIVYNQYDKKDACDTSFYTREDAENFLNELLIAKQIKDDKYYILHGGYLKHGDRCAKDGDKVTFSITGNGEKIKGHLYFNDEDGNFLVQDDEEKDNPYYLWEVSGWELMEN